ncbi:hypothetical protein CTI12_AA614500 [Artemisia annua]|uniref:ApaG domain-containing protein n=1 Tax=Artemisia annua TaxID=35608 RepID=A0A2U1KDY4_ARTAN|nr:hypothetical protein CTI12_AA614500 [Artemisia annua]
MSKKRSPTYLESLGHLETDIIISKLNPSDVASVACVNTHLKSLAYDDSIWSSFCKQQLNLSSPIDPQGNLCPSFKAAYGAWREAYSMYPWPLVRRVNNVWGRIRSWLTDNFSAVLPTLRKGASEDDLNQLEESLNVKLPLPTRVLYRFCDGQELSNDESMGRVWRNLCGLLGGYFFRDHTVNVFLLPLNNVIQGNKNVKWVHNSRRRYIIVASSLVSHKKFFFLDCEKGQLLVGTKNSVSLMPCVSNGLITTEQDSESGSKQDGMLLWLEEYVRRLEMGFIRPRQEGNIRSISLFPEEPSLCSVATTSVGQSSSCALFLPDLSELKKETEKYVFAYKIRFSLKPERYVDYGRFSNSGVLIQLHLIIKSNENVVGEINEQAMIDNLIIHADDGVEFVCLGRMSCPTLPGSVEGSLTFIPTRMGGVRGNPIMIEVAKFPLLLPADYIF